MNIHDVIMKAADQIDREPARFDFGSVDFPDCGSPACAIGWIAHFMGIMERQWNDVGGLNGITGRLEVGLGSHAFYLRMDCLCGGSHWRREAKECARALRLYAEKYHAQEAPALRTDAQLVKHWMAVVRQKHYISCNVRLRGVWRTEWRTVRARDLSDATKKAEAMPDVQQVYEVSFIPGGVVT